MRTQKMEKDVTKIIEALKGNLVTLVEYNNGDETKLLAVCNVLNVEELAWIKQLGEDIIVFTKDEVVNGLDVFPVEFLNIKRHHRLLFGEDIINNIEIKKSDLRWQLEFEFRSKLIGLRQAYIKSKDEKRKDEIILSAVPTLAPIIGALMYLRDMPLKYQPEEFKSVYGVDTQVLKEIYEVRQGRKKLGKDKENYIRKLIVALEHIGKVLNDMKIVDDKVVT